METEHATGTVYIVYNFLNFIKIKKKKKKKKTYIHTYILSHTEQGINANVIFLFLHYMVDVCISKVLF